MVAPAFSYQGHGLSLQRRHAHHNAGPVLHKDGGRDGRMVDVAFAESFLRFCLCPQKVDWAVEGGA